MTEYAKDKNTEAPDLKKHAAILWNGSTYVLSLPKREGFVQQEAALVAIILRLTNDESFYKEQVEFINNQIPEDAMAQARGQS